MLSRNRNLAAVALLIPSLISCLGTAEQPSQEGGEGLPGARVKEERDAKPAPNRERLPRAAGLEEMKKRWVELEDPPSQERLKELAVESARLLFCEEEMLDLLEFLEVQVPHAVFPILIEIKKLFGSDVAGEARESLARLSLERKFADHRSEWCIEAGKHCPGEAFGPLHERLMEREPTMAHLLMLGRNISMMKSDPLKAVESTLEVLEVSDLKADFLNNQLQYATLPKQQMKGLEELIHRYESEARSFELARNLILRRWGKSDLTSATEHVLSNQGRFSPNVMNHVAEHNLDADWVRRLPEGGCRDRAASTTSSNLALHRRYAKAWELLDLIENQEIRELTRERIKAYKGLEDGTIPEGG